MHIAEETHYFDDLRPRLQKLKESHSEEEFTRIVEDYFLVLSQRPYGQGGDPDGGTICREELRSLATELGGTPDHVFEAFCQISARNKGKQTWGEKTPRHVFRIDEILERYPQAKVVCMIRDGRAVVTSYRDFKKGTVRDRPEDPSRKVVEIAEQERVRKSYHVIIASLLWRGGARAAQKAFETHGSERVLILRYEDLVADAPGEMAKLCAWRGVSFDEERLSTIPIGTSSYADGVQSDSGVSSVAVQRWRAKMSESELHTVEATSGDQLRFFGYELVNPNVSLWLRMKPWVTLPWAMISAIRANAGRHGGIGSFIMRRIKALR